MAALTAAGVRTCGHGMCVEPITGVKGARARAAVVTIGARAVVVATCTGRAVRARRLAVTHHPIHGVSERVRPFGPSRRSTGPRRRPCVQPGCRARCEHSGQADGGERATSFHSTLTSSVPSKRIRSPVSRFMLCSHSIPSRAVSSGDTPPPRTYVRLTASRPLRSSSNHE
jgi:hypothetical protein